jgi:hypothetical protein
VYWVNNQQLLAWMKNPTNIADSITNPELDCVMPAQDASNPEICDGIDNNGDGTIDKGMSSSCYYPAAGASFSTCFGCPPNIPSVNTPIPLAANYTPNWIPDNGCPNQQAWDPQNGVCVNVVRKSKEAIRNATADGTSDGRTKNDSKNASEKLSLMFALIIFVVSAFIL